MKKYMYMLGAIILTIVLLYIIIKYKKEAPLPEKFNDYKYLSEGPIESDNYEIIKIIENWKGSAESNGIILLKAVFYDTVTKNTLFFTDPKDYEKIEGNLQPKAPYQIFWKMNDQGKNLDSIKIDYSISLHNSGVFFHNNYFIDWVNNDNKTKQKYTDIIDGDSLPLPELENLISSATMLDIDKDYDNEIATLFLKEKEGWTKVKSKRLYKKTEGNSGLMSMYTLKPYIKNHKQRFIELDIAREDPIQTEHFVKKSESSISLGDYNSQVRSGTNGIGYFKLKHKSELITFKGYAFNKRLDKTYVYYPIEKEQDFIIMYLQKRTIDDRPFKNTGVYVLRKK